MRLRLAIALSIGLAAALLASACATEIGGARVTVRPGTRVPGYIWATGDGVAHQMEPVDPPGDTIFLIVRGRY